MTLTMEEKIAAAKKLGEETGREVHAVMESDEFFAAYEYMAQAVAKLQAEALCDADTFVVVALLHAGSAQFSTDISRDQIHRFLLKAMAAAEEVVKLRVAQANLDEIKAQA
jgi:hypothetical protein